MRQQSVGRSLLPHLLSGLVAIGALFAIPLAASAQSFLPTPPPVVQMVDENHIDLLTPGLSYTLPLLSIGPGGRGGITYEAILNGGSPFGWTTNLTGGITAVGAAPEWTGITVGVGGHSDAFALQGSCSPTCVYTDNYANGATMTVDSTGQLFTYTVSDGTVYKFNLGFAGPNNTLTEIDYPTGEVETFNYATATFNQGGTNYTYTRLQSVTTSTGYGIHLDYDPNTYMTVVKATAWNMAVEYCNPTAASCSFTQTWPTATFSPGLSPSHVGPTSITDAAGVTTTFGYSAWLDAGGYYPLTIQKSSGWTETIGYSPVYGCNGIAQPCTSVSSVTYGSGTWTYTRNVSGLPTARIDPFGQIRVVGASPPGNCLIGTTHQDELGRITSYLCDTSHRITQITLPEGGYTSYTYDGRGNLTQVTKVAKPGSGLSNITVTASYDSTCIYPAKCNRPNSVTDALGNVTTYSYDNATGLLLTEQKPAVIVSGASVQPTTLNNYAQVTTYALNSSSQLVAAGSVWKPTSTATCAKSAPSFTAPATVTSVLNCANGTSDKVISTTSYSGSNNALPTSVTSGSGDGLLAATTSSAYDNYGDITLVTPPLGSNYATATYYNLLREKVGVVGPDPDGGGSLLNRAQRITYNSDGLVSETEQGTENGYNNPTVSDFTSLIQTTTTYDSIDRKAQETVTAPVSGMTTTFALTQYSYDAANRLQCTAVRMSFSSLPSSACTLVTPAVSYGQDRVTYDTYDAASELLKVTAGYGTSAQRDEKTVVPSSYSSTPFTGDGLPAAVMDGNGNVSTYVYDGFDRTTQLQYPSPTNPGVSSTTDYEGFSFDANGNVTSHRLRDGTSIGFTYDALNRKATKTPPETANAVTYGYDQEGHLLSEATPSQTLTFTYDALGRKLTQGGPLGTVSSQWDPDGRRTRLTWPDTNYIAYTWDNDDEMLNVEENGLTSGAGLLATFSYDNLGHRLGVTRGNGTGTTSVSTSYGYDAIGRLTSLAHSGATNTQGFSAIAYNPADEMVSFTTANGAYAWNGASALTQGYALNGQNQYTAVGGSSYAYDLRGNLTTTSSGGPAFSYDSENRLTGQSGSPGPTLAYYPDGSLWQTTGGSTTRFQYDGDQIIGEYDGSSNLLRRYVPGPGVDEPLVWYEGSILTNRRWLLADHLGSVIAWADTSGSIPAANINSYDDYGQPGSSNTGRFQYTGQAWIPEIGVYDYRARNYMPGIGRFLQTDPKGYDAGLNLYAYAEDDPIDKLDHDGRRVEWVFQPGTRGLEARAQNYLMNSPHYAANFQRLESSRATYTVVVGRSGRDQDYDFRTRTIHVDPTQGMRLRDGSVQSAAVGGQAHEVDHAAQHDKVGTEAFRESLAIPMTPGDFNASGEFVVNQGTSREEQRATRSTDNVARDLGEPTRGTYHNAAGSQQMPTSTSHVCTGSRIPTDGPC